MKGWAATTLIFYSMLSYANYESIDNIKTVVNDFITSQVQVAPDEKLTVQINHLDSVAKLPACSQKIQAELTSNITKQITTVQVNCNSTPAWHVFVPVEIQVSLPVVVAKHNIIPHETITDDDLDFATYDKNRLFAGYFKTKSEVVNNVAAHLIMAGTVLSRKNIDLPVLVHRSQAVTIVATSNQVSVSMQGIAKSDGALNSSIKVINPSSKRELDAVVIGPNKAQILF